MRKIIALFFAIAFNISINAQLQVDSLGRVGIGNTPNHKYAVQISGTNSQGVSITREGNVQGLTQLGLSVLSTAYSGLYSYGISSKVIPSEYNSIIHTGVYGMSDGSNAQNYGVFGRIIKGKQGAAICGSIAGSDFVTATGSYAGYFHGATHVQGDLSVSGSINGIVLGSATSDVRSVTVPSSVTNTSISENFLKLTTHAFLLDPPVNGGDINSMAKATGEIDVFREQAPESIDTELSFKEKQIFSKQHFGLDADELEKVFPDLVYENEDGSKSINYVEMVPILVQAINELKSEIDELRGNDGSSKKVVTRVASADGTGEDVTYLSLGQNKPNPFATSTTFEVCIPEDIQSAFIYVYDLTGKKLQQIDVYGRGKQTVSVSAASLTDGMYLYSLIADGKVIETRKMIVEK